MWPDFDNYTIKNWKTPLRPNSIIFQMKKTKSNEVK